MSTTTCHLSSIEICNGDDVILLPIKYTHLTETSQLVYGTNKSCTIAHLPLFGKYEDYGRIKLDEKSEENCDIFRSKVNKGLMNNKKNKEKKSKSIFYTGDSFYIFKRENFNQADSSEWHSDIELMNKVNNEEQLFNISEIETNKELLNYLDISALVEVNGRTANRFGYLLIRKDIYEAMVNELYSENKSRINSKIQDLLNTNIEDDDIDSLFRISESYLSSDVLELHNVDNYLVFQMLSIVRLLIKTKQYSVNFTNGLLCWALISKVYADLGKSFYPNVRKHSDLKPLYVFNSIVQKHIEKRQEENVKSWMEDTGEEVTEDQKWNDYRRIY